MLIDQFLPKYQTAERHRISVHAPVEVVYRAVRSLDLSRSPLIRGLFRLRGFPPSALTLKGLLASGFALLGEVPNEELLLGLVGKFWSIGGDLQPIDAATFRAFRREGYAKSAWNFTVTAQAEGMARVATETRIYCLDERSRRRFRLYWFMIGPFSGWIRREMLRVIKRAAEEETRTRVA